MIRFATRWTLLAVLASGPAAATDPDDINEGQLRFVDPAPSEDLYTQTKHITLSADSLASGWVASKQCHYRLDPVPALQVVFAPDRVRRLRIVQADNIGRARVEGSSVQLDQVGEAAVLCLVNESRVLEPDVLTGGYTLRLGPFMRRFLDGYFPLHIKLAIDYPPDRLRLTAIQPDELGRHARHLPGSVRIDAIFEGRLDLSLHFDALNTDARP